jgi:hypothetical protein
VIIQLEVSVSTKTVRHELHRFNVHGRAATAKPLITQSNAPMRKRWCHDHKTWPTDKPKRVMWSDKSSSALFLTSGTVDVSGTPKEAYNPECLAPTAKQGRGCVISWYSVGPIISFHGRITASEYVNILGNQVHPMIQSLFPNNDAVLQDDTVPIHTARTVQSWFEEHDDKLQHLPWPAQSPDLNITEPLCSVLETTLRNRFPPLAPLK